MAGTDPSQAAASAPSARKRVLRWVVVLLGILVVALGGMELFRQYDLWLAEREFYRIQSEARGELGDVQDWESWYLQRIGKADSRSDITALNERCRKLCKSEEGIIDRLATRTWAGADGSRHVAQTPNPKDLQAFIEHSAAAATTARSLLKFERLHVPPQNINRHMFTGVAIVRVLEQRVRAWQELGEFQRAWDELALILAIATKFSLPASGDDRVFAESLERSGHTLLIELAKAAIPPAEFDKYLSREEQPGSDLRVAEDLVVTVIKWDEHPILLWATIDDGAEYEWRLPLTWLDVRPPFFSRLHFSRPVQTTLRKGSTALNLLETTRELRRSERPDELESVWPRVVESPDLKPLRERSKLVFRIRRAQANDPVDSIDPKELPSNMVVVRRTAAGWELRWNADSTQVRRGGLLFDESATVVVLPDLR